MIFLFLSDGGREIVKFNVSAPDKYWKPTRVVGKNQPEKRISVERRKRETEMERKGKIYVYMYNIHYTYVHFVKFLGM